MRKTWCSSRTRVDVVVERSRAGEVVAEGLLDHHAAEGRALVVVPVQDARRAQQRGRGAEQPGPQREVAQAPDRTAGERIEVGAQSLERGEPLDVRAAVMDARREGVESRVQGRRHRVAQLGAERLVAHVAPSHADDLQRVAGPAIAGETDQRRHELAPGEVAGAAENEDLDGEVGSGGRHARKLRGCARAMQAVERGPGRGGRSAIIGRFRTASPAP